VAGGPWVLTNIRIQANTSLTRGGMARSDVALEFGGGNVAAPAVFVDRELAGANALVERFMNMLETLSRDLESSLRTTTAFSATQLALENSRVFLPLEQPLLGHIAGIHILGSVLERTDHGFCQ
jgi:hypothetical protein